MRAAFLAAALLGCSSCNVLEQPSGLIPRWTTAWKEVATGDDRQRLADWRTNFVSALDAARKGGHAADVAREGVLLEPDAALGPPGLPDGIYRCRVIKLGAKTPGMLDYIAYPAFSCRVQQENKLQGFAKLTGSQRPVGLIFPNDALRQVFLGTLVLGDEDRAMQYGNDPDRDVAAFVERIGPARWRMVMPAPAFESTLDVIELTPAN